MSDSIHVSETFGKIPNTSESFRTIPQAADDFRTLPKFTERKESHTLTVREVARLFESAGVARTERSIINWCQPNKLGMPRLDAYYDPNERRYFITPQSVELAIKEEQAKAIRTGEPTESGNPIPKVADRHSAARPAPTVESEEALKDLQREVMNLTITDRVKEQVIKQYEKERGQFALERKDYIEQLLTFSRRVGELETKVLQLAAPRTASETPVSEFREDEPL